MSSSRFSAVQRGRGRLVIRSLIVFFLLAAVHWSVPEYSRATECSLTHLSGTSESFDENQHSYSFSGFCVTQYGATSVNNFHYDGTGVWQVAVKTASEKVSTPYGNLTRQYQCDYDPWLEPKAQCSETANHWAPVPSGYTASSDFHAAWAHMNSLRKFPVSAAIFDQSDRQNLVNRIMAQSIRVIDPVMNEYLHTTNRIATVTMERPVISPPNHLVVLKMEEIRWPEPGLASRNFSEAKTYLSTADRLITYFNLKDRDLWDGRWQASAHLLSTDPYWSPHILFEVAPKPAKETADNVNQELAQPIIHNPRRNRTYTIEEGGALEISYPKQADLHLKWGYRAAGQSDFEMLEEKLISPDSVSTPGFYQSNGIANLALLANAEVAEIKIEAWCTSTEEVAGGWSVAKESEHSSVVTRVLVSPMVITSPLEGQVYGVPAQVSFVIPVKYQNIDYDLENYLEVQMFYASSQGNQPIQSIFTPYGQGSFTTFRQGETLYVRYDCPDIGRYRLRARISIPASSNHPALQTPWTDWRAIEVKSLLGSPPTQPELKPQAMGLKPAKLAGSLKRQAEKSLESRKDTRKQPAIQKALAPESRSVRSELKTVSPALIYPRESQTFKTTGPVQIRLSGVAQQQDLAWQIQYKSFEQSGFRAVPGRGVQLAGSGSVASGSFLAAREGVYRLRFRAKAAGNSWGNWRNFTVGEPPRARLKQVVPENEPTALKPAPVHQVRPQGVKQPERKAPDPVHTTPRPTIPKPKLQPEPQILGVPRSQ